MSTWSIILNTPPVPALRLLADANIPWAAEAFGPFGEVRAMPGRDIGPADVAAADVLVVRSVTRVGRALLEGSPVRFVGSATAGTDHVDEAYLHAAGVAFTAAPGSNAVSVVDYVLAALLDLLASRSLGLAHPDGRPRTLGVVGAGHVGGRLIPRACALGLGVLATDPPLALAAEARGEAHPFLPLRDVLTASDVLSLHPPLTGPDESAHPTRGLIGAAELGRLPPGAWVVNAARGEVVDERALAGALASGRLGGAVLDVWAGEPSPDPRLVALAHRATPHVAGYGFDGKVEGTRRVAAALRRWLEGLGEAPPAALPLPLPPAPSIEAPPVPSCAVEPGSPEAARWLDALASQAYPIRADDARFRAAFAEAGPEGRGAAFTRLRATYPERRTWGLIEVKGEVPPALQPLVREGLGFGGVGGGR